MSHIGDLVRNTRERRGWRYGQLARAMGMANLSKASQRLQKLEKGRTVDQEFWDKVCDALDLTDDQVRSAANRDWEDYQNWLDQPVPMQMIVKLVGCFCATVDLPAEVQEDPNKAEEFARQTAIREHHKVCLVISRRLSIWFDECGNAARTEAKYGRVNTPTMTIRWAAVHAPPSRFWSGQGSKIAWNMAEDNS